MDLAPITLTLTARDAEHARRILAAVARAESPADSASTEFILTPSSDPPAGHTYRELCDARRAGLLEATMTRKGLVFTEAALEAYRATRADRRRRPKSEVPDTDAQRRRALTNVGILPARRRV